MKVKKIYSFLVACMLLCGSIGLLESQTNSAYATPKERLGFCEWIVWGTSLYDEIPLAEERNCPQGIDYVLDLINRCIEGHTRLKILHLSASDIWFYAIEK